MDFTYRNIKFDINQLVKILCCDLQVTIHEGLLEIQMDLLEAIGSFIDQFQTKMATLSLWGGGQAFLEAIHWGKISTQPESFLQDGPS